MKINGVSTKFKMLYKVQSKSKENRRKSKKEPGINKMKNQETRKEVIPFGSLKIPIK